MGTRKWKGEWDVRTTPNASTHLGAKSDRIETRAQSARSLEQGFSV